MYVSTAASTSSAWRPLLLTGAIASSASCQRSSSPTSAAGTWDSPRDFLKRTGVATAYLAFLTGGAELLAAACGPTNPTNTTTAVKGGKLIEGSISDLASVPFNTLNSGDTTSTQAITHTFDGLLGISANGDNIPMLAAALPTVSSESLTITFKLT